MNLIQLRFKVEIFHFSIHFCLGIMSYVIYTQETRKTRSLMPSGLHTQVKLCSNRPFRTEIHKDFFFCLIRRWSLLFAKTGFTSRFCSGEGEIFRFNRLYSYHKIRNPILLFRNNWYTCIKCTGIQVSII